MVLFPQWGIEWEMWLDDLPALRANMAAWNRWAVAVRADGGGRLHPVGHLSLRGDLDWLDAELRALARRRYPSGVDLDRAGRWETAVAS